MKIPSALLVLCILPVTPGNGAVAGAETTRTQLIAFEHQWVEALQNHDTAALDRMLADSFVDSTFRGAIRTKQDMLKGARSSGSYRSIRLDDLTVRSYGEYTAIVNGVNVLQGTDADDIVRVRFTDVFILTQGRWQAVSAQETVQASP